MNMYLTLQNPKTRIQNALKVGWSAILFIALWLGISLSVWAQPQYNFTAVGGTFTPLVGSTDFDALEGDDVIPNVLVPIGFTFVYDGTAYTQLKASSNGWVTFNTAATGSNATNDLNGFGNTIRPLLAPLWDDLDGRMTDSKASYSTTGAVGSRVFTIEYLNWGWKYSFGNTTASISFQVKLYEANGVIEYIYRSEAGAVTGTPNASIGLTKSTTGVGQYFSLSGSGTTPTVSSTVETTNISTKPATGQIYRWSPTFSVQILSPADDATGVALNSNLSIGFAYPATPPTIGTGNIELRKTTGDVLVETFTLPSARVTISGNNVVIDPTNVLECNTEYHVNLPATALGGVGFTGITTTTAWSFTTTAPVGQPANVVTLLDENFATATGSTPPTGWVNNTIGGATTDTWRFNNPGNRGATGFTAPFAIFDSDNYSTGGGDEDVALETPAFDASATGRTYNLSFKHYFNDGFGGGYNVEIFNGTAWVSVYSGTTEQGTSTIPDIQNIDITTASGANAAAKVRFRWTGDFSWYWIVDDVKITSNTGIELPLTATFTPTNGATNVAQNSDLVLNFPYSVSAGTGNIEIVNATTNAVLETIAVGNARVDYSTVGQVTIDPANDFPSASVVAVRFPTGAFKSCNNLDIAGITTTTDWRFTVVDPCAALTISAGPDQFNVVSGSNVTLAGVAATGGSGTYTYAWTPAANLSDPTILAPVASSVTASTTYTLTVTDTGTGCTTSDGVFISVAPPGGGGGGGTTPTVTAPTLRITDRSATTMTLNWTGGNNAEGYTVFRKGGTSANFVRVRDVAVSASTFVDSLLMPNTRYSYYVQAVRSGVTANSNIVSDFTYPSVPIIESFQNACVGTGAQLTVKGSTGLYNVYSAATGGTVVVSGDSTSIITTPTFADSTTFYISAIGSRYESTPRVAVRVITRPLPTATMLGAALQESCTDSLTIMAEAVEGATYTWYSSNISLATTSTPMYTVNRSGVYSVLVNKDGCVARSGTIRVRVNRISPAEIAGLATRQFCEAGFLNAVETEGATYEWQRDNTVVGTGSSLEVTQSGNYTVTVTSILGCVLTSTPVTVTVINVPQLDLQSSAPDFCEGTDGVELTVNSVSGASYEWLRNGRRIRTTSTPSLQVNVGAEYRVRVVLNGNCSRTSDPVTIIRNAAPAATARVYGDSIKVVYVGNVAITSVTWTKDDAPFSATTQAFAPTESGLYVATITYETGCQVVSSGTQYIKPPEPPVVVGEEDVEALGFMLFPNPTASKVNLSFGDAFKGDITLTLTDAIGRTIQVVKVKASENATLDLSNVANGNYMLTIASDTKVVTRKIIRE